MRSILTTVLLLSCLVLATGQAVGRDASPEPVDLTYLSLDQLLDIQVAMPAVQARPVNSLDAVDGQAHPGPLGLPRRGAHASEASASALVSPPALGWPAPALR